MLRHSSKWILAGLAVVAAQATTGCSNLKKLADEGSANVSVTQSLSVAGDVKTVEVTVAGTDIPVAMTLPLFKQGDGSWKGLLSHIPTGTDRTFAAKAFDASHLEIYSGSVPSVTIEKDKIAKVDIVLQENVANGGFSNHAPVVDGLTVSSSKAIYGQKIAYTLTAHDQDAGETATLAFNPQPSCGSFGLPVITTVAGNRVWSALWTAPMSGTSCQLNMEVKDVHGAKTMSATTITLWSGQDTGGAQVNTQFQSYPTISNIEAAPVPPAVAFDLNVGLKLNVLATQPDGEAMTFAWSTPCTGSFDDATKQSPVFTLTAAATTCAFQIVVSSPDKTQSDGTVKHMSTTGHLEVVVGAKAAAPELGGVVIDLTSQSQDAINSSESVTLYIRAREMNATATLQSFAWSTPGGGLGTQTDAPDKSFSQIVWTAPAGFSTAQNITVTVTDSQGASASFTFNVRSATNPCAGASDGTGCSDGNPCTMGDTCQVGVCTGGPVKSCPASDDCHDVGVCDPGTGACSTPAKGDGTGCALADLCVTGAACSAGTCVATDHKTCTAKDDCHEAGTCTAGACSEPTKLDGTTCAGPAPDACHLTAVCQSGVCGNPVASDTTTCSTGDKCMENEHCVSGSCGGGSAITCANPGTCKTVACVPSTGCVVSAAAEGDLCNDGDGCTVGDRCVAGSCQATGPMECSASDKCHTIGSCSAGACPAEIAKTCDYGQTCTPSDGNCHKTCPVESYAKNYFVAGTSAGVGQIFGMTVDGAGNQFIVAKLFDSVNFGSGTVTSAGSSDIALAKLDPTTGLATWTKTFSGTGEDTSPTDQMPASVAVNKDGKIAMIGTFTGNLVVNGTTTIAGGADPLDFILGTDAAGNGQWGLKVNTMLGGLVSIASHPARTEFVVCGYAAGAMTDLGLPGTGGTTNKEDIVIAMLNDTGTVKWSRQIVASGTQLCNSVALAADGTVYALGQYNGAPNLGDGALPNMGTAVQAIWVAKLDNTDGHSLKSKSYGTSGKQSPNAIALDAQGNIAIGGGFRGTVIFDGISRTATGTGTDAFVALLDSTMTAKWAVRWGDASDQAVNSVAITSVGDVVAVGDLNGSATLDKVLTSLGGVDALWTKLDGANGSFICSDSHGNAGYDQSMGVVAISSLATGAQKDKINIAGYGTGAFSFGPSALSSSVQNGFVAQMNP